MKQVVSPIDVTVRHIDDIKTNKIYAFKAGNTINKLQSIGSGWGFVELNVSIYHWGNKRTAKEVVQEAMLCHTVYEFDTLKEFAEWLVKETK